MVRNVKRILERHFFDQTLNQMRLTSGEVTALRFGEILNCAIRLCYSQGVTSNLTGHGRFYYLWWCRGSLKSETAQKRAFYEIVELDYILTPNGTQFYVGTPHCFHTIYTDAPREGKEKKTNFLYGFKRLDLCQSPVAECLAGDFPLDPLTLFVKDRVCI